MATIITGTAPAARSSAMAPKQRLRIHPAPTVGIDQPQRAAADAGLMRDFQPRDVTFP